MNNPPPFFILILIMAISFLISLLLMKEPVDSSGWIKSDPPSEYRLTPDGVVFERQDERKSDSK